MHTALITPTEFMHVRLLTSAQQHASRTRTKRAVFAVCRVLNMGSLRCLTTISLCGEGHLEVSSVWTCGMRWTRGTAPLIKVRVKLYYLKKLRSKHLGCSKCYRKGSVSKWIRKLRAWRTVFIQFREWNWHMPIPLHSNHWYVLLSRYSSEAASLTNTLTNVNSQPDWVPMGEVDGASGTSGSKGGRRGPKKTLWTFLCHHLSPVYPALVSVLVAAHDGHLGDHFCRRQHLHPVD